MILIYNHMDRLQIEISPCYKEVEDQKQEFYIGGGNDIYIYEIASKSYASIYYKRSYFNVIIITSPSRVSTSYK